MIFLKWLIVCSTLLINIESVASLELRSYISEHGLHGTIDFIKNSDEITVSTNLNTTLEYPDQVWSWFIKEFPVDYTRLRDRCGDVMLGRSLINLDDIFGYLILPENSSVKISTKSLRFNGDLGIYGKSLLLVNVETGRRICGSLTMIDKTKEKTAVARFHTPISGNVHFRWFFTKDNHSDMLITTDLYHVRNKENYNEKTTDFTEHIWKIFVTDILESDKDRSEENCNILQLVFDPKDRGSGKALGDIDSRLGKVKVSTNYGRIKYKTLFRDSELILLPSDLNGPQRRLYLVIFESKHPDTFLACAKIRYDYPIHARAIIQAGGIKGDVSFLQNTKFEPTFLKFNFTTARGDLDTQLVYALSVTSYKIHELPIKPPRIVEQNENACLTTKFVYNPTQADANSAPPNGYGTQDQYLIGDLSGKYLGRNNETTLVPNSEELNGVYWDVFLPLQGKDSVIHRSLIIYKRNQYSEDKIISEPWICGTINLYEANYEYQKQMSTAQVLFRYPIVGRMILRQAKDEPWSDTSILVEYLVHADGASLNNTADHRWAVHELPPGKDFYNWTGRCLSAGQIYNPFKVDYENKSEDICNMNDIGLCRLGDLSKRHELIQISGKISDSDKISRKLWTDPLLPIAGPQSIIGKSLLVYDDHGPKFRGERLACSIIGGVYRRKAVAKDWFPNGDESLLKGKIEFYQQTEYDITNIEVGLEDLKAASEYHIHLPPVEENLEFPCESSSLYGIWNPLNVDQASSPQTYQGTPDQYQLGDLSGKFGKLDNFTIYKNYYNDSSLAVFGPRNVIGKSVVIHKKKDGRRWACSTIERGYSPSEARELRAIASFHHPNGYAFGYIKMRQLIYHDGSSSDTTIEVKLRHPGKNDRNITRNHNWAIYVNPVGVDAAVQTQATRCVAGGYVWNPFYTQLADPLNEELYRQECGPENPLRCHVGDLSSRLGTIDIGLQRKVFSDTNFPLEGPVSAVGRSIVIMSPERRSEKYACANIEPDNDIIKFANIEKPPRFVVAQFIEDIRAVMGIPEWFLTVDTRKTKVLHNNACVQLLLHFKGPISGRLEQDFNRLMSLGRLDSPSLFIPGYINEKRSPKISYKLCGVRDPNEKSKKRGFFSGFTGLASTLSPSTVLMLYICTVFYVV